MTDSTAENLQESTGSVIDPLDLEQTLLDMAQARADDPQETYAQVYTTYLPRFNNIMNELNAKGKVRVINFIMQYPFNEKAFKAVNKLEQEAMAIGHAILEAKYSMIMFEMLKNVGMINETNTKGELNDSI